jgi:hypothetical protein
VTPAEWAEVFEAGMQAIPGQLEPAANALALALRAMSRKAQEIAERAPEVPS